MNGNVGTGLWLLVLALVVYELARPFFVALADLLFIAGIGFIGYAALASSGRRARAGRASL